MAWPKKTPAMPVPNATKPASGLFPKRKPSVPVMGVPGMMATRNNLKADRMAAMPKKGR